MLLKKYYLWHTWDNLESNSNFILTNYFHTHHMTQLKNDTNCNNTNKNDDADEENNFVFI